MMGFVIDPIPPPPSASGLEGKVIIGFDIGAEGRATSISLVSSDDAIFEKPAMDLLTRATFELPKGADGQVIHEARYRAGFVRQCPVTFQPAKATMNLFSLTLWRNRQKNCSRGLHRHD